MNEREKEIYEATFGRFDYRPWVRFYDHPSKDEDLTQYSGRPRYVKKTHVMIKPRHPDLRVRDSVSRVARESDTLEYAEEYQAYLDQLEYEKQLRLPLRAIPGMNVVAHKEMEEVGIRDCHDLAEYEGDLGAWNYMKDIAAKLTEISNACAKDHERRLLDHSERVRQERERIRDIAARPEYTGQQTQDGSVITPIEAQEKAPGYGDSRGRVVPIPARGHIRRDGPEEKEEGHAEETFSYSFQVQG